MRTLRERDAQLEKLWKQFGDVPMDPDTEKMEEPFMDFPVGTDREDIWHWFDERHSKGVVYLLYGRAFYEKDVEDDSPLLAFIKQEVPYRLREISISRPASFLSTLLMPASTICMRTTK